MIKQFMRRVICRIDFWYYIRTGGPLTKTKYYKKDIPNKYWGRCLVKDGEVAPYCLVYCMDPKKIKVTEKDRKVAEELIQKYNLSEGEKK